MIDDGPSRLMRAFHLIARRRKRLENPGQDHRVPLYQLLVQYRIQNCKDLRDKVYGLLGLAQSVIAPDYAMTTHDLYLCVLFEGMYLILTRPSRSDFGTDDLMSFLPSQYRADAKALGHRLAWFDMFPRALVLTFNIRLWDRVERTMLDRLLWHTNLSLFVRAWIWERALWKASEAPKLTWYRTAGRFVLLVVHMAILIPYYMLELSLIRQVMRWRELHFLMPNCIPISHRGLIAHVDLLAKNVFDKITTIN